MTNHTKYPTVNVFFPCDMDMFTPTIPHNVIRILEKLGYHCLYNPESTCCGRKFYMDGAIECARQLGEKLLEEFDSQYPIIIPSSACAAFIKNYYRKLFENVTVPNQLKNFTQNTFELCDFLVNEHKIIDLNATFNHRVFYFKSCSAKNQYRLGNEVEQLLSNVKGLDLLTDNEMDYCCSANSRFAMHNPELSDLMLSDVINTIYSLGAQFVTSTDIHCLQFLDSYIQSQGIAIEVIHIADILVGE